MARPLLYISRSETLRAEASLLRILRERGCPARPNLICSPDGVNSGIRVCDSERKPERGQFS
jgi:hypothetical protein